MDNIPQKTKFDWWHAEWVVVAIIAAVVHLGLSVLTHEQPAAVAAPAE